MPQQLLWIKAPKIVAIGNDCLRPSLAQAAVWLSAEQVFRMEAQMVFNKGRDGEVAVIVTRLYAQR